MDDVGYILSRETNGDANAKNPRSSATGLGQFIDSTWLDVLSRNRPDIAAGRSPAELLALRSDPDLSREMTGLYAAENNAKLARAGFPASPGNTYLAHFAGPQGAVKVLGAAPDTPVAQLLDANAIRANPHLNGMTAADLVAWAGRGKGGGTPGRNPTNPPKATNPIPGNNPELELGDVFANYIPVPQFPLTSPAIIQPMAPPPGGNGPFSVDPAFEHRTFARSQAKHREFQG